MMMKSPFWHFMLLVVIFTFSVAAVEDHTLSAVIREDFQVKQMACCHLQWHAVCA